LLGVGLDEVDEGGAVAVVEVGLHPVVAFPFFVVEETGVDSLVDCEGG